MEAWCEDTGYPETRFDERGLAAADLLRRLARGDGAEMGALLARAVPAVPPQVMTGPGPELTGRVTSSRWPVGGPPAELLGPAPRAPPAGSDVEPAAAVCGHCGRPLQGRRSGSAGQVLQRQVPGGGPPGAAPGRFGRRLSRLRWIRGARLPRIIPVIDRWRPVFAGHRRL